MREALKNLATLESIVCPEWEYRYFSYNADWSEHEEMASMRDGCGSEWFVWFKSGVTAYKCYSSEDGAMDNLEEATNNFPAKFDEFLNEAAFSMQRATCIWYMEEIQWVKFGKEAIHIIGLQDVLSWEAKDYCSWAAAYYEREIAEKPAAEILAGRLNESVALQLNPELNWEQFSAEWKI